MCVSGGERHWARAADFAYQLVPELLSLSGARRSSPCRLEVVPCFPAAPRAAEKTTRRAQERGHGCAAQSVVTRTRSSLWTARQEQRSAGCPRGCPRPRPNALKGWTPPCPGSLARNVPAAQPQEQARAVSPQLGHSAQRCPLPPLRQRFRCSDLTSTPLSRPHFQHRCLPAIFSAINSWETEGLGREGRHSHGCYISPGGF